MTNTEKKESKYITDTGKSLLLILYNMFFGLPNKGSILGRMTILGKAF